MRFLLASIPLFATSLVAQQFPEVEPNDTPLQAQAVALGSQINCNLVAAESDWYTFTTPGGYHRISLKAAIDTQLELWDGAAANVLAFSDDGQGTASSLWMNLSAGTYYLRVDGFSAATTGAYSLDVAKPDSKPTTSVEAEPNDVIATATPVGDGTQLSASLRPGVVVLADLAGPVNTTTVVQSTAPLLAGAYADGRYWLRFTTGLNAGQQRRITANTVIDSTVTPAFTAAPVLGDAYEIVEYDSDYYRIDVTAPRAEVVFSITEGNDSWVSGWSYEVRDPAGALINSATLATNLADSGTFNSRVSSFRVWPTGTYYVRVFHRRTALTGAPAVAPLHGNYRFEVKIRDMNILGVVPEAAEPNNTVATATPITPGQQGTGNITISTGADASDWWGPITVATQSLITFQTDSGVAPGILDTTINLRQLTDPVAGTTSAPTAVTSGNILNTTVGASHARGAFNFLLPGTVYYLEVISPGTTVATQEGNYVLEISIVDVPTYSAGNWASAAANATGCGTAGVPTIGRVIATELPIIGQTLVQRVTNLNGLGNLGLMVIGTSGALGPSGAAAGTPPSVYNPQPLDISFLGAPGCTLNVNPLVIDVLVGDPSGTADYVLPTPGVAALAGATLFFQPCKWDFATPINPLGIQPGNWSRVIFGTRAF